MKKCCFEGCAGEGLFSAKVFVPATGHVATEWNSASAIVGLAACTEHRRNFSGAKFLEDILTDQFVAALRTMVRAKGGAAPDFERAWVRVIRCDSPEYQLFDRQMAEREKGGKGAVH